MESTRLCEFWKLLGKPITLCFPNDRLDTILLSRGKESPPSWGGIQDLSNQSSTTQRLPGKTSAFFGNKKVAVRAPQAPAGERRIERRRRRGVWGCGEGVSPSPQGEGSGEVAVPPPQKIFYF